MKTRSGVWLMLAVALMVVPAPAQSTPADPYTEASKAFAAKDYERAAALFAQAAYASASSQHPDTLLKQALCLVHLGRFPQADGVLRRHLQANPKSSATLYLLAYVLQRENDARQSLAILTQAAAITRPTPDDLKIAALDYVLLDDYKDAIQWLTRALTEDPRNEEAWYDLGRAQMHQGDYGAAVSALQRALALNPQDAKAWDNLGLCYEAQNRVEDALATYPKAIAAQQAAPRRSEQPLLNFATLLDTRGRYDEAIPLLQQAIELAPKSARCHEELAHAYIGLHKDDLARVPLQTAVDLDPANPRLHFQLGQLLRRVGLAAAAEAELKRSASLYSTRSSEPKDH